MVTPELMDVLSPEEQDFLVNKLSSKWWRMNNLYKIVDKEGRKRTLVLNSLQERVLKQYLHPKKIILKSRQTGISTLYVAVNEDDCIFLPGYSAGIQSYGQDEAAKLQMRADLMWREFPSDIKEMLSLSLDKNNQKGMMWNNDSVLKIGNFRGDTLQSLHVSELGKIAKKYPEKAKELKTGAFQAVSSKNRITIESTAEGMEGLFYDMWQKAQTKIDTKQDLTVIDFQPIFLAWMDDADCYLEDHFPMNEATELYLKKLYEVLPEWEGNLSEGQINWLGAKLDQLGEDFNQEYPATPEMAFAQSVEGTYFLSQYKTLNKDGRIAHAPHVPDHPVHVSFDLGVNDEMVLLFAQVIHGRPRLIDDYHNTGEGLEYYINIMHAKRKKYGYKYDWIIWPHDGNVTELGSGLTRIETARKLGMTKIKLLPRLSFQESIQTARVFLGMCEIDRKNCFNTVLCLQNYRKKWDKQAQAFMNTDVHNIHSNYAAALRYMAQGLGFRAVENKIEGKKKRYEPPKQGFAI